MYIYMSLDRYYIFSFQCTILYCFYVCKITLSDPHDRNEIRTKYWM